MKYPTYPREYSTTIVWNFVRNYARATKFFAQMCRMSSHDFVELLIGFFMYENNRWNVMRDLIKWVEKTDAYGYLSSLDHQDALKYLTVVKTQAEDLAIFEKKSLDRVDNARFE